MRKLSGRKVVSKWLIFFIFRHFGNWSLFISFFFFKSEEVISFVRYWYRTDLCESNMMWNNITICINNWNCRNLHQNILLLDSFQSVLYGAGTVSWFQITLEIPILGPYLNQLRYRLLIKIKNAFYWYKYVLCCTVPVWNCWVEQIFDQI